MNIQTLWITLGIIAGICRIADRPDICARGPHTFQVIEEEGVPTSLNTGDPKYHGDIFRYERVLVIPQDRVYRRARLKDPSSFTLGEDGMFYVLDAGNFRVAVFDSLGRFVRSFGREGEDFGEFVAPVLQGVEDGIVSVYDLQTSRLTRYTTGGMVLDTLSVPVVIYHFTEPPKRGSLLTWYYQFVEEYEGFYRTRLMQPLGAHPVGDGRWVVPEIMLRPRADTRAGFVVYSGGKDTLTALRSRPVRSGTWVPIRVAEEDLPPWLSPSGIPPPDKEAYRLPFAPLPSVRYVQGRGVLLSTGQEPVLEWYDLEGKLTGRIRMEMQPPPVTPFDRVRYEMDYQAWYDHLVGDASDEWRSTRGRLNPALDKVLDIDAMGRFEIGKARGRAESVRRFMEIPETKACWTHVWVDDSGYIWLRVPGPFLWYPQPVRYTYWILSPEGEFLGATRTPATTPAEPVRIQEHVLPVPVARGHFMALEMDEKGEIPVLTVYRISSAVAGFRYP